MRGRRKEAKKSAKEVRERANEIKDQAREAAGAGGEALKEFASHTGVAAKEFASKAGDAAKEFVEQIEKAAKGVTEEEPKKRRKLLRLTVAIAAGTAIATNERARSIISRVLNRKSAANEPPEIWRAESSNGGNAQKATAVAPGTAGTDKTS